jgi:hypothetical protein
MLHVAAEADPGAGVSLEMRSNMALLAHKLGQDDATHQELKAVVQEMVKLLGSPLLAAPG